MFFVILNVTGTADEVDEETVKPYFFHASSP
jgi:hypothetical protein